MRCLSWWNLWDDQELRSWDAKKEKKNEQQGKDVALNVDKMPTKVKMGAWSHSRGKKNTLSLKVRHQNQSLT